MNTDILKGKWKQVKGSVRNKWGQLTDDDLDMIQGDSQKLVGILQERYGYARERAELEMNEFLDGLNDMHHEQGRSSPPMGSPREQMQQGQHQNDRKRRAS